MPVPSAQPVKKTNPTPPKKSSVRLPTSSNLPRVKIPPAKTIGCSSLIYFLDSMIAEDKEVSEEIVESKSHLPELELHLEDHMDWWPELSDLDRLNVLAAHREDRARLLASKDSKSVDSTIKRNFE